MQAFNRWNKQMIEEASIHRYLSKRDRFRLILISTLRMTTLSKFECNSSFNSISKGQTRRTFSSILIPYLFLEHLLNKDSLTQFTIRTHCNWDNNSKHLHQWLPIISILQVRRHRWLQLPLERELWTRTL